MTAPVLDRKPVEVADPFAELEESFSPTCEFGSTLWPTRPECDAPADWIILGHDCDNPGNTGESFVCNAHLDYIRKYLNENPTYCAGCNLRATTAAEWIFREVRIR